jgi:hypothetical protein
MFTGLELLNMNTSMISSMVQEDKEKDEYWR